MADYAEKAGLLAHETNASTGDLEPVVAEFLRLVVVTYSETVQPDVARFDEAAALLSARSEIAKSGIYAAAAAGDVETLNTIVESDPGSVDRKGGPFDWEPIMYAAYSRLPGVSSLPAGRALIAAGADPNAHYMWGGQYKFTALTGVFGQGEGGPARQPAHPETEAFARLLLEAGADPNDSQAAYNRMFTPDNLCLELLLEYGLRPDQKNNWLLRGENGLEPHSQTTMHYQLLHALHKGMGERVRLLVEHGADVNAPGEDGRTPFEAAMLSGYPQLADYLTQHGAERVTLSAVDAFIQLVMAGNTREARILLNDDPDLVRRALKQNEGLLTDAAGANNLAGLQTMIAVGFDLDFLHTSTALHQAAWHGRIDAIKLLIEAGADPTVRDTNHFSPPIGWAQHNAQRDAVAFLATCAMDVFTAAAFGNIEWLQRNFDDDPACINAHFRYVRPAPEKSCDGDWNTPLVVAAFHGHGGAVDWLLARGGDSCVTSPDGKTISEIARTQGHDEIAAQLSAASS